MTTETPDTNTLLAVERTRLAYERSLMAWIRTATSLITFGFAIYKFFQFQRETGQGNHNADWLGPSLFAEAMIVVGMTALALAWIQHHLQMKALRGQFGRQPFSLAGVVAALIAGLGLLALLLVAFQQ